MSGESSIDCVLIVSEKWKTRAFLKALIMENGMVDNVLSVDSFKGMRKLVADCAMPLLIIELPLHLEEFEKEWLKVVSKKVPVVLIGSNKPKWITPRIYIKYPASLGEIARRVSSLLVSH